MQVELLKRLHPPQAWSLRLFSGSQMSEETFLPLRHPSVLARARPSRSIRYSRNIERAGQLSYAVLAEKVGMEPTTLTSNLRPLTRANPRKCLVKFSFSDEARKLARRSISRAGLFCIQCKARSIPAQSQGRVAAEHPTFDFHITWRRGQGIDLLLSGRPGTVGPRS